jgi:DNA polymerase III epsilon subunit-like protein
VKTYTNLSGKRIMDMITRGLVIDTETGGLDSKIHPLLTTSFLVFQVSPNKILDNFHLKILPPEGTVLEVQEDPQDTSWSPKISHYVDADGVTHAGAEGRPVITAGAARVNGFSWESWKGAAVPLAQADTSLKEYISTWFSTPPVAYAHNSVFDDKFVHKYLPSTYASIRTPWLCSMRLYQKYMKFHGEKSSAKLAELAKRVNEDPSTTMFGSLTKNGDIISKAHDAGADTEMCYTALMWLATKLGAHQVFPGNA